MLIRYFAAIDDTPLGKMAMAYCESMVKLGHQVRLISSTVANLQVDARGKGDSEWGKFRRLLLTNLNGSYVNVVCTEPEYWGRLYTKPGKITACLHNVVIAMHAPSDNVMTMHRNYSPRQVTDALQYPVIVVPTREASDRWRDDLAGLEPSRHATVVAPNDIRTLATALTPY